jgi:hypothetical protein
MRIESRRHGANGNDTKCCLAFELFLASPNFRPSLSLRCRNPLPACSRNCSLFGRCYGSGLGPMQVSLSERGESGANAGQFIRKAGTFPLKLADY